MHLSSISLEDFRNIKSANLSFSSKRVFFLGPNGQGKTNLLEAIGMSSSLRSFRKSGLDGMVRQDQIQSRIFYQFQNDEEKVFEVLFAFKEKGEKFLELDGERVKKLNDYLGHFPSVCLSSRDFRLIRDGPSERRRWLDMVLSSSSLLYFETLKVYHKCLRERNALLKKGGSDSELDAFEKTLIPSAHKLFEMRSEALPRISESLVRYYQSLSSGKEKAGMKYRPDCEILTEDIFAKRVLSDRERDRQLGSTRRGPHRDDFEFILDNQDARTFASEGQQRGLVLGLRLAEFDFLKEHTGVNPLLITDDVLGELDNERRSNFTKLLPLDAQVFASGTSLPSQSEDSQWQVFEVIKGTFTTPH